MPTSPSDDAVQHQSVAAGRILPAVTQAIHAAARGATEPPELLSTVIEAAVFTALISIAAMSFRRTPTVKRPSTEELRAQAEKLTPGITDSVWKGAVEHVANKERAEEQIDETEFARSFARTVGAQVSSATTSDVADLLGWPYKVWLTRGDDRVRSSHRHLHGRVVETSKPFETFADGQELNFPGDPRAPVEETANCRCFLFASPTKAGVAEALQPADLDKSFALAASLEQRWFEGDDG